MKYRRAVFLVEPGEDPAPAFGVLRRVAPQLERLLVLAPLPDSDSSWLGGEPAAERREATLQNLRGASTGVAPHVDVQLAPELRREALAALCAAEEIDLIVFGSRTLKSASVAAAQRSRLPVAVLWAQAAPATGPIEHIGCVALDERSRAAIGAFLRDHADPSVHVAALALSDLASEELATALQVAGIRATVEVASLGAVASTRQWLDGWARQRPLDLLVFARIPGALLLSPLSTAPVLLLPPLAPHKQAGRGVIDVPDLVDEGGPIRVRIDRAATAGNLVSVPDQSFAFVSGGRVAATVTTAGGEAVLPAGLGVTSVGVYRTGDGDGADPLASIEDRVAVLRPGDRPLVVFDSELSEESLRALARAQGPSAAEPLAVRLRPVRSCRATRRRLRAAGLPARVLDARIVLDEGEALDVSAALDPVRLARVAAALRRAGFPVTAMAHQGPARPLVDGFAVLSGPTLEAEAPGAPSASASSSDGNRIQIEMDNATARRWLLEAIEQSRQTLHLQVYMAQDDDVGRAVEAALSSAGARGVTVRVLIDSLHGLHGSFGAHNPLLERLAARPGVELRTLRPITELPSLADLKQRDHRKLVVADGRLALLGGRNLSHEYYTAFGEVAITSASPWRSIPWLDAGARVEGPAVAALSRSFLDAWIEAGGAPFEVVAPPPAGASRARVVVHRGLRDARTLEAYLELIETARSHVTLVNGFPLLLEIQHALVRALGRGVRVRTLIGHLTPTHGGHPFSGPWSAARNLATELVHSRMDPVVAAGGEAYLFARHEVPGWEPGLGVVYPHVHAKAMSADGLRCAVGSANLDVTASYWESELLLVVEDAALARAFEAELDAILATSMPVDRDDPAWRQHAKRRAWMRHWPGVLSA